MSLSKFPIGSRVRVLPIIESVDPAYADIVGLVGTIIDHDDPYLAVAIDGKPHPYSDVGWLLEPSEVEPAS